MIEPRLKSSVKWSELPTDIHDVVQSFIRREFSRYESEGEFIVEGRIYPEEIILRLGFLPQGSLRQDNFEVSLDFKAGREKAVDRIQLAIEVAPSLLTSYFDKRESDFPYEWRPFEFDEDTVFLRYSPVNSRLEAEADRLLGENTEGLIQQTAEMEKIDLMRKLGLEDVEAPSQPTSH